MKNVKVLPPELISKIAAGEVIERPASIVKELIENALDAGATSVELTLKESGKKLIQIKDNGHGIDKEDLETIFLRHSTSKIKEITDLFNIHSLGFRGEALYSISAISDVILSSKTADTDSAWSIHIQGNIKQSFKPTSFNEHGTHITVRDLFFNTPVRKKFLKSNIAELNHILNIVIPLCLLKDDVHFLLKNDDKVIIDIPKSNTKIQRIAKILNLTEKHLLETTHTVTDKDIQCHLIIGDINIVRGRRDLQFLFINNRPVENKNISFHINNVCRLIFPPNKFPSFCVFIELPPEDVDVNVHPTKKEVTLKDESAICSLLRNLSENILMTTGQIKQAVIKEKTAVLPKQELKAECPPVKVLSTDPTTVDKQEYSFDEFSSKPSPNRQPTNEYNFPISTASHIVNEPPKTLFETTDLSLQSKLKDARFIGFFRKKYILFEYKESLLVVDQHAAQERINYEKLIIQMSKGSIESQRLLSPEILQLNAKEILMFNKFKEKLTEYGFECTLFDSEAIAIHSYPILISNIEQSVRNLLAGEDLATCDHNTIARRACKSSIRAYEDMSEKESLYQRNKLLECLDPFTCPHGRPTIIELTEDFLDKNFLRS